MPARVFITEDTAADCAHGERLIEGIDAGALLDDRGYDTDSIVLKTRQAGMQVVIPSKKNRKVQREYDRDLYKLPG